MGEEKTERKTYYVDEKICKEQLNPHHRTFLAA
jgi:hypothetical protein